MTLNYIQLDTDVPAPPATRELQVGCIRTTQLSPKKVTKHCQAHPAPLPHCPPGQPGPLLALPLGRCGWAACWAGLRGRVESGSLDPSHAAFWELCPACNSSAPQTVEFSLDSATSLQHKGFTIEPCRGFVERGQTKTISIAWLPPADFDVGATDSGQGTLGRMMPLPHPGWGLPGGPWAGELGSRLTVPLLPPRPFQMDHPLMVSALLQLKGDVKETYKVFFVAQVVTSP